MLPLRSAKSARSIRSVSSDKSQGWTIALEDDDETKRPLDFDDLLPLTCAKFNCPYVVAVRRESRQEDYVSLSKSSERTRKHKKVQIFTPVSNESKSEKAPSNESVQTYNSQIVVVGAVHDSLSRLIELHIHQAPRVPRLVIQVIALFTPYLENLTKLSIRRCRIDAYTAYELNKLLDVSFITEIHLEDTPVPEGNYAILLDKAHLKYLTLCRCRINDAVCKEIADRLHHNASSGNRLLFLSLPSNHITDIGAKYLGQALRTNRALIYLNLSDNHIADTGAGYLLDHLCEFPLSHDEVLDKRSRYVKYLRKRHDIIRKFLSEQEQVSSGSGSVCELGSRSAGSLKKRRASASSVKSLTGKARNCKLFNKHTKSADMMVGELLGPFVDIFSKVHVTLKNDWIYCKGNLVLSSLNLSYNRLSYTSVKKVLNVLNHQDSTKKQHEHGLVRIVLEGNPLPESCSEMANISYILNKNLNRFGPKVASDSGGKRKSRTRYSDDR